MTLPAELRGHVFKGDDASTLPSFVMRRRAGEGEAEHMTRRRRWAEAETERYRIVAHCALCKHDGVDRPLIAEEVVPHRMKHLSPWARSAAGTVLQQGPEIRAEALAVLTELLNADGSLR